MQINAFVNTLEEVNGTDTVLTGDQRRLIQNISQDLNAALKPSETDDIERPILPQDLQTAVILVAVVAQ